MNLIVIYCHFTLVILVVVSQIILLLFWTSLVTSRITAGITAGLIVLFTFCESSSRQLHFMPHVSIRKQPGNGWNKNCYPLAHEPVESILQLLNINWDMINVFIVRYVFQTTLYEIWRKHNQRKHGKQPMTHA